MITLAIETSQRESGVALRDRGGTILTELLLPKKRNDDDLMPAIDRLFKRAKLQPCDLRSGTVCVSIGPGGFTGLRIAVSTAKMFAETLSTRIVAVPSAMVAAEGCKSDGPILVALASKNASAWVTRLDRDAAGHWAVQGQPGIIEADSLDLNNVSALLGDEHLPHAMRDACVRANVPVVQPVFDPRACLMVGERMLAAGQMTDPLHLLPLYPREPEAVTLWRQRHPTQQ